MCKRSDNLGRKLWCQQNDRKDFCPRLKMGQINKGILSCLLVIFIIDYKKVPFFYWPILKARTEIRAISLLFLWKIQLPSEIIWPLFISKDVFICQEVPTWVFEKLCNQVPSISLSRWRTLTLSKILISLEIWCFKLQTKVNC